MSQRAGAPGLRPGTASRLKTGMRPETKGGAGSGVTFGQGVKLEDRPITQQGVGGLKTAGTRGYARQVEDKSYFIGLLRNKINELSTEIGNLHKECTTVQEESSSYVQYEKMAESLAAEIKELQGELGDYNTLFDKLNTDQDTHNIQMDLDELKLFNDREEQQLDQLFEERKTAESEVRSAETELVQEKRMADSLVQQMPAAQQKKYFQLKDDNEKLLQSLEQGQQELEALKRRHAQLEDEIMPNPIKQEAVRLHDQLRDVEDRRDALREEARMAGDPQQDRERLLAQVKDENQEIANIEKQTKELHSKVVALQEEIRATEQDIDDTSGQRTHQYRELKKREEQMEDFLSSYEEMYRQETSKLSQLENNVVEMLDYISRNTTKVSLPSASTFQKMQEQLKFKTGEAERSEFTANTISQDHLKVQQDLAKIDQLETKTTEEIMTLKERIKTMKEELLRYNDINSLVGESEDKSKSLMEEKVILVKRKEIMKKRSQKLSGEYEKKKAQLHENETFSQLSNLERKWQQHEQNNFVMKEFIANKTVESDTGIVSSKVGKVSSEYNRRLIELTAKSQGL